MPKLRPIDRWFIDEVLPYERRYIAAARALTDNEDEARDLVQEVYVKLFSLDGWAAIESPVGYVLRMLRNLAIEHLRRAKIVRFRQLTESDAQNVWDESPDAFRVMAAHEQLSKVMEALEKLPECCRAVLVRRRFADETPTQIARATGESLSTLEKRLARGMQLLTQALAFQGMAERRRDLSKQQGVHEPNQQKST
jgi:RNA polymerase sigma-70 factor (ECF subfamily)